jgi:uncharacterized protein (TIGR00725 family)
VYVAVIGSGEGASDDDLRDAEAVGRELARRGVVVVTGGLGGVMAAAARGCTAAGGTCVGLLPGSDRSAGNPYLSVAIATGLGELRNGLLVRTVDGVIAVGGSWGTLSELALALRAGMPVVALRGWQLSDSAGQLVEIETAAGPSDAVGRLLRRAGYRAGVSDERDELGDDERVETRGQLLPEEQAAGSDDPELQAEVILADSDERTAHPEETKRRSTQTPD